MANDESRPGLTTPTGGAMTVPRSPEQWHGHPFVWAWFVSLASLSTDFIEARCREAQAENAPADAVYKTTSDDGSPGTWVTVEQLSDRYQARVRDYGNALLKWERDLAAHRQRPAVQAQAQPLPEEQPVQAPAVQALSDARGLRVVTRQPHQH